MNKYSDIISIEDFPEKYQSMVEIVGIDKALEIARLMGGTLQYIPKLDELDRKVRNAKIRNEFTGYNISELAARYGLTEVQIRNIVKVKQHTIEEYI